MNLILNKISRLGYLDFYYKRLGFKPILDFYKDIYPDWKFQFSDLSNDQIFKVVHLFNPNEGGRFIQMVNEGLHAHPNVNVCYNNDYRSMGRLIQEAEIDIVSKMLDAHFILRPNHRHFNLPKYDQIMDQYSLWSKVIIYDKKDGHEIEHDLFDKCLGYVKRSFPKGYARMPRAYNPKLLPLDYSILDEYVSLANSKDRTTDVAYFFLDQGGTERRSRTAGELLKRRHEFKSIHIGTVSDSGNKARRAVFDNVRDNPLTQYFDALCASKIVITAYPSDWDGDSRTWEALSGGALVVMDRTYIPSPYPLVDGEHVLIYDATSKKSINKMIDRVKEMLQNPTELTRIATQGYKFALEHHNSRSKVDLILKFANRLQKQ